MYKSCYSINTLKYIKIEIKLLYYLYSSIYTFIVFYPFYNIGNSISTTIEALYKLKFYIKKRIYLVIIFKDTFFIVLYIEPKENLDINSGKRNLNKIIFIKCIEIIMKSAIKR